MGDRPDRSPHQEGGDEQARATTGARRPPTPQGTALPGQTAGSGGPYPVRVEPHRFCMLCAAISR